MARKKATGLVATRSFRFAHVRGPVVVEVGDEVDPSHPAVRKHPDWFITPTQGTDTPNGEE